VSRQSIEELIAQLSQRTQTTYQQKSEAEQRNANLQTRLANAEAINASLRAELAVVKEQANESKTVIDALMQDKVDDTNEIEELRDAVSINEATIDALKTAVRDLQVKLSVICRIATYENVE